MDFLKRGGSLLGVIGLIVGLAVGYVGGKAEIANAIRQSLTPIEENAGPYAFVRPLLAYRTPEATLFGDYVSLKNDLQSIVDSATRDGTSRVAVYFRDLDAARWIGINQNDTYYPASLLKVPVLITYYKEAETQNPDILTQDLTYNPQILPHIPFELPSSLVPGNTYSVQALITHMVTDSDNGATFTLLNRVNPEFLNATYTALGIPDPGDNSRNYQISARIYGLFFRILYNATYLSPHYSEEALSLLSQSTFTNGLVAGVPKGIVVAHKYGEHVLAQNGSANGVELSDCGIVYYPAHPYLLCVMTSAPDEQTAASTIANLSHTTYSAVQARYASSTAPFL